MGEVSSSTNTDPEVATSSTISSGSEIISPVGEIEVMSCTRGSAPSGEVDVSAGVSTASAAGSAARSSSKSAGDSTIGALRNSRGGTGSTRKDADAVSGSYSNSCDSGTGVPPVDGAVWTSAACEAPTLSSDKSVAANSIGRASPWRSADLSITGRDVSGARLRDNAGAGTGPQPPRRLRDR